MLNTDPSSDPCVQEGSDPSSVLLAECIRGQDDPTSDPSWEGLGSYNPSSDPLSLLGSEARICLSPQQVAQPFFFTFLTTFTAILRDRNRWHMLLQ